jgi:hypothetical protein
MLIENIGILKRERTAMLFQMQKNCRSYWMM